LVKRGRGNRAVARGENQPQVSRSPSAPQTRRRYPSKGKAASTFPRGRVEKQAKRDAKRGRRRAEKIDPENAPKKTPYRGHTT